MSSLVSLFHNYMQESSAAVRRTDGAQSTLDLAPARETANALRGAELNTTSPGGTPQMTSTTNNMGGNTFHINISSDDPAYIWEQIRRRMEQEVWRG